VLTHPHHRNSESLPGLSLTVEPLSSPLPFGRAPKGPLDGGLISRAPKGDGGLNSRACLRIQFTYLVGGRMVEHLKVLFNLLICPSNKSKNGRAPKGDGGLNSRACLRILISRAPKGDGGLNSRACYRILFNLLIWCY